MSNPQVETYVGEIRMFSGSFAPAGWELCNGQLLSVQDNDDLYSLLGTTYGGDGRNNFALPDLRGRIPVHQGAGPGLTQRSLGDKYGAETQTLTVSQLASHTHPFMASESASDSLSLQGKVLAKIPGDGSTLYADSSPNENTALLEGSIGSAGENQPHSNMMPYTAINFIIALGGSYPHRN